MRVYNVELFSPAFEMRCHDNTGDFDYSADYMSVEENSLVITYNDSVKKGDFIRIYSLEEDYFGVVTSVEYGESNGEQMSVFYKPYTCLFDTDILFDTDRQGTGSLELEIRKIIIDNFMENDDTLQNLSTLGDIKLLSNTADWGLNLKSDTEGMHRCIVNFYNTFLVNGFEKYGIAVNVRPDYSKKKVNLTIGTVKRAVTSIETALPNILDKSVTIRETSEDTNKLELYNDANYTEKISYYLHPDGSYDTINADRIAPVIRDIQSVTVEDGKTFSVAAASAAAEVFGQIKYNNLIEITVMRDDSLYPFQHFAFGQEVDVIHNGISYRSIYSGIEISDTVKLIFGAVRLDLTKIIKEGI